MILYSLVISPPPSEGALLYLGWEQTEFVWLLHFSLFDFSPDDTSFGFLQSMKERCPLLKWKFCKIFGKHCPIWKDMLPADISVEHTTFERICIKFVWPTKWFPEMGLLRRKWSDVFYNTAFTQLSHNFQTIVSTAMTIWQMYFRESSLEKYSIGR